MWCSVYLVVLAAGAITVTGITKDVLKKIPGWTAVCLPPQPLGNTKHLKVECEGLSSLHEVRVHIKKGFWRQVASLTVSDSYLTPNLSLDDLVNFPALHTLTFRDSRLSEWREPQLQSVPSVKTLVLDQCWDSDSIIAKYLQLTLSLTPKLGVSLPALEELHIIKNYMEHLGDLSTMKHLRRIVINGGAVKCERENLWLLDWYEAGQAEINSTVCYVPETNKEGLKLMNIMFSFVDKDFLMLLRHWKRTVRGCIAPCSCSIVGVKDSLDPMINTNCSGTNLTELPNIIPEQTTNLILTNNSITHFSKMFTNPLYHHLDKINLEHNLIEHMDGDLFYKYAKNRSLDFSIRLAHNKLETLPVKLLKKVYDEGVENGQRNLPTFTLGNNPWNCDDCSFLVDFQNLVFYQVIQREFMYDIRCGEGRYAGGQQVIKLPVRTFCKEDPPLQPLDIFSICLGILLILFILNFIYNLAQYRRHGKLPWIITKLPCC